MVGDKGGGVPVMKMHFFTHFCYSPTCQVRSEPLNEPHTGSTRFVSEKSLGRKFGKLNKAVQDLFIDWLPYEKAIFENRYIDPLDLNYLKSF